MTPCIYCRRIDVPRNEEHVLQQAFGATAVLDDAVCADCNGAFSALDKDFVDAVDFFHLGKNMRRPLGLGLAAGPDGFALRTRLRSDGFAERAPQVYEAGPNEWRFIVTDHKTFEVMVAELADPGSLVVTPRLVPADGTRPPLSIVRSSPRTYLVEGTDERRLAELCTEMKAHGLKIARMEAPVVEEILGHGPPITYNLCLDLARFGRAMAKVALNFVCYRLGTDTALLPTFDPLRAFAREGTGDLWTFVKPSLLTGMDSTAAGPFTTGHGHVLVLMRAMKDAVPHEAVIVVISGRVIGNVSLQPVGAPAAGLPQGTWLISRCDPVRHRWDHFRMPDDAYRAIVSPAALGLEAEWKAIGRAAGGR